MGARNRKTGLIKAEVMVDTTRGNRTQIFWNNISIRSPIYTDEANAHESLIDYEHSSVRHSASEYVNGKANKNTSNPFRRCLNGAKLALIAI